MSQAAELSLRVSTPEQADGQPQNAVCPACGKPLSEVGVIRDMRVYTGDLYHFSPERGLFTNTRQHYFDVDEVIGWFTGCCNVDLSYEVQEYLEDTSEH